MLSGGRVFRKVRQAAVGSRPVYKPSFSAGAEVSRCSREENLHM